MTVVGELLLFIEGVPPTTHYAKTGGGICNAIAGGTKPLQYQRPNADVATLGWTPVPNSPTTLFDKLNEATPNDTNYVTATADVTISTTYGTLTPGATVDFSVAQT